MEKPARAEALSENSQQTVASKGKESQTSAMNLFRAKQ